MDRERQVSEFVLRILATHGKDAVTRDMYSLVKASSSSTRITIT